MTSIDKITKLAGNSQEIKEINRPEHAGKMINGVYHSYIKDDIVSIKETEIDKPKPEKYESYLQRYSKIKKADLETLKEKIEKETSIDIESTYRGIEPEPVPQNLDYLEINSKYEDSKFELLKFVISARAINGTKPALNYVCVNKNEIVTTDSRRLHLIKNDYNLKDGLYEVIKNTKTIIILRRDPNADCTYPNYQQVIPTEYKILLKDWYNSISGLTNLIRALDVSVTINPAFINDLYMNFDIVGTAGPQLPILFKSDTHSAIVMPIKYHLNDKEENE